MARITRRIASPQGVAAGQTATIGLPIGQRYHWLALECSATAFAPSDITELRVIVNNKPIYRMSGDELDSMNQFYGRSSAVIDAGSFKLIVPFDRFNVGTRMGEEETAINTGSKDANGLGIDQFSCELDLAAGITGTIVITPTAEVSEALPGGAGTIPYRLKTSYDLTGTGEKEIADLPRQRSSARALDGLFFRPSANTITELQLELNGYSVFRRTSSLNYRIQTDGVRVPQAGWWAIDRTEHGYGGDPIGLSASSINDFRCKLTIDGSMNLKVIPFYLGELER